MTDQNLDDTLPTAKSSGQVPASEPEGSSFDLTQPTAAVQSEPVSAPPTLEPDLAGAMLELPNEARPKKKRSRLALIPLIGILGLTIIAVISGLVGYRSGIGMRTTAAAELVSMQAAEQFQLSLQDMEMGFFERARQRLEYVIRLDPSYPGAADRLAEVLLEINTTATPTQVPTPTLTPTPDIRGVQGMFDTANQQLANAEWDAAIETALKLRKQDPTYRAVDIDGLIYLALRSRGMDKIAKQADLEGGLYDLALTARFGPLDNEAQGFLNWATLYLTGASFWDLDWRQVVFYFEQIAPQLPYLTDGSGLTAIERYRLGLIGLGNTLMLEGDSCTAAETYQLALTFGGDLDAEEALNEALEDCNASQAPPPSDATAPPAVVTDTPPGPPPPLPTTDPNATPTP